MLRMSGMFIILYKKQYRKFIQNKETDTCAIFDDNSIIYDNVILNLETLQETHHTNNQYYNNNEGFLNSYDYATQLWSRNRTKTSISSITNAKGAVWEIKGGKLKCNNKNIADVEQNCSIMCTINNDTVVIHKHDTNGIFVYNSGKLRAIEGKYFRFYGCEYVVDMTGNVFKLEVLNL